MTGCRPRPEPLNETSCGQGTSREVSPAKQLLFFRSFRSSASTPRNDATTLPPRSAHAFSLAPRTVGGHEQRAILESGTSTVHILIADLHASPRESRRLLAVRYPRPARSQAMQITLGCKTFAIATVQSQDCVQQLVKVGIVVGAQCPRIGSKREHRRR